MGLIVSFDDYTPAPRFDGNPWTEVQIEEGATSVGPWTLIDTIALSPLDTDPAHPVARSFTTDQATAEDLWYRVIFADAAADTSLPSSAVQNAEPSPTLFVSSDEFASRLGLTLTADEEARADTLLALASGLIQQETGQKIELVENDAYVIRGRYSGRIRLPQRPVISVASVVLNPIFGGGTTYDVPTNTYYVDRDELVRAWPFNSNYGYGYGYGYDSGVFGYGWGGLFGYPYQATITYTHGFATIPELVKAVCMEMVTRVWVNPGSVARETIGDTSTVYDNMRFSPTGLLLTDEEKKQLNDLLRRRNGTVALR